MFNKFLYSQRSLVDVSAFHKHFAGKMALWNKVVSGFDKEEETVNFGARAIAENNGSLYETCTTAIIQSNEKVFNINFILIVKNFVK